MLNKYLVRARSAVAVVTMITAIGNGGPATSARQFDARHDVPDSRAAEMQQAYANLPVAFVENRGQADARVRYYAQGSRYAFHFTRDEVVLSLLDDTAAGGVALALRFPGSSPQRTLVGEERAPGEVNYFLGQDQAAWRTGIPRYSQVAYRELWPGVDLRLREQAGTLKYELRIAAGARLADVRFAYAGATGLTVDGAGALRIATSMGTLRDSPPVSYQMIDGRRAPVDSRYVLIDAAADAPQYGFAVGAGYRPDHDLIIDPGVEYSTLLGGSAADFVTGVKADTAGNAYVVGTTQSSDFPTTVGAFKRTGAAQAFGDVFVSKINQTGSALVYSTFIGGNDFDWGRAIAIDLAGNAYVTGQTKSPSFPTTGGAFDRTFNVDTCPRCGIDQYDAFVTKLNSTGTALVYSTFLGGFDIDDGLAITVDAAGSAYVTGETGSSNFPVTPGAFDTTRNGAFDAFVSKLNPAGSTLLFSTFLGGSAVDFGTRIALDTARNVYVVGPTSSTDFPTTPVAFDTTANGGFDLFVAKLNSAGSLLTYSTYLGGSGSDSGGGLAIDPAGNAYVSGGTSSRDFPTTPGAFDRVGDDGEAFVTELNAAGSDLLYSTFLGGSGSDGANAVVLDSAGNAWLTGITNSDDFPVTAGAFDSSFNGVADVFISELNPDGTRLLYSTYLGGAQSEGGDDIAIDPSGDVYVAGHTYSIDFPTTFGAFDIVFDGNLEIFWGDGFVTKVAPASAVSTPPSSPPVPAAPALQWPANGATEPQPITFQWSGASGAASYTIQIDDSSAFNAPLVRQQQDLTILRYATTGLAPTLHFWRVRGVNIDGVPGPWSAVRSFTAGATPPPAVLGSFETNPSTVSGGELSSGTVVLSVGAPEGGALIGLSSSNPAVVSVPATVLAPANSFTGTFAISTAPVTALTTVTLTATYNSTTRTATVTVMPAGAPLAIVQNLMLSPSTVSGGATWQGVVTLSSAAPQGGAVVSLSSSNTAVAGVPATVTVNAGATIAVFNSSAASVTTAAQATITAIYNSTSRSAVLTVTPPAPPPPPPQTATLTVTVTGRSGERVTSSPAGISVRTGSSGTASFASGARVTLSSSRDAIWSGACSSGGNKRSSCTFTLTGSAAVTANVQ